MTTVTKLIACHNNRLLSNINKVRFLQTTQPVHQEYPSWLWELCHLLSDGTLGCVTPQDHIPLLQCGEGRARRWEWNERY